jgi:mono/diheme cytochrome c family protein
MKMVIRRALVLLPAMVLAVSAASDTAGWVDENCAGCHALDQAAYENRGIESRPERRGPPLFYAGNKFREPWLVTWLQSPERIRPAGDYPPAHIETVNGEDRIDTASLSDHPAVMAGRAEEVAGYLMTLRARDDLTEAVEYEPGNIAWRLGQMNFAKFNNCIACHQDEADYGGLSGPELYTAWDRLQPEFIASYIADPVAWDPYTLMPGGDLNDGAVAKLTNYLKAVAEEEVE